MLQKNPGEMGRTVNKYFHRVLKDSYGALGGPKLIKINIQKKTICEVNKMGELVNQIDEL